VLARVAVAEDAGSRGNRGSRQPADEAEQANCKGTVLLKGEDGECDVVRPCAEDGTGGCELEPPQIRVREDVPERPEGRTNTESEAGEDRLSIASTVRDEKMWEESRPNDRLVGDLLLVEGREHQVSDQENITPDEESDVEAHKAKVKLANEGEAKDDTGSDDDVELHKKSAKL
jgi:hypothetical protein